MQHKEMVLDLEVEQHLLTQQGVARQQDFPEEMPNGAAAQGRQQLAVLMLEERAEVLFGGREAAERGQINFSVQALKEAFLDVLHLEALILQLQ